MHADFTRADRWSNQVIGAAIEVHRHKGAGLLESILPIHKAQLLSYMKLINAPLGLLINFHCLTLKDGLHRLILPEAITPSRSSLPSV